METMIDPAKAVQHKLPIDSYKFTSDKCIIYALGIGFSKDQLHLPDLRFTYEKYDNFTPFLTMIGSPDIQKFGIFKDVPGLPIPHRSKLLHAEQYIEIHKPIKVDTEVLRTFEISDVFDKKSGALLCNKFEYLDPDTKEKYATVDSHCFLIGSGGFEKFGKPKNAIPKIPEKEPTHVLKETTSKSQALLYRLVGDDNPLHVDPDQSKVVGFSTPILHGMCTFGVIIRSIFQKYCEENPWRIKKVGIRFTSHVFPGETLIINTYQEDDSQIIYSATTKERGKVVAIGFVNLNMVSKM